MTKYFSLLLCLIIHFRVFSQEFIPLWPKGGKPNFNGNRVTDSIFNERAWRVDKPGIYSFLVPEGENTGTSVLICPGGGYERVSFVYNGFNLANWYNSIGVNAFVLIYRLPHQKDLQQRELAPLQDAQRAMKLIRRNAGPWKIKPDKIGVMGISAGGHLATMLGTHSADISIISDSFDIISCRPDFMILLSPVVTMDVYAHPGSKKNFLGPDTTSAMIEKYSNELQVSSTTPPAFMVHASNDKTVNVRNSLLFYQALTDKSIKSSIHIFPQGGHGIRLDNNPGSTDLWTNLLELWLKEMDFVKPLPFK